MPQLAYPTKMMWPRGGVADNYVFGGQSAALVADHAGSRNNGTPFYRKQGATTTFSDLFGTRYDRSDPATMFNSSGNLVWNAHNIIRRSNEFNHANWNAAAVTLSESGGDWTMTADAGTGQHYIFEGSPSHTGLRQAIEAKAGTTDFICISSSGVGSDGVYFDLTNGTVQTQNGGSVGSIEDQGDGWYLCKADFPNLEEFMTVSVHSQDNEASNWNAAGTENVLIRRARSYVNTLGGMATVPSDVQVGGQTDYVETTGSTRFLSRRENYRYNGSAWVIAGHRREPATTNLLLNTNTLSTQSATVTNVSHTLHFTGTGTITLSGASTAGPLVGTGTGEENRVSLVFTPSAGSLTLTVSGTVTNAQLEVGLQSSYIPSGGSQSIRATDVMENQILAADMPYAANRSYVHHARLDFADDGSNYTLFNRQNVTTDIDRLIVQTAGGFTGSAAYLVFDTGVLSAVSQGVPGDITPGIDVPVRLATRIEGGAEINLAYNGTAETAVSMVRNPDNSDADLDIGSIGGSSASAANDEMFVMLDADIGDAGIEEATA